MSTDVVVRELPDGYPNRVYLSKEEGWVTEQQTFSDHSKQVWVDDVGPAWTSHWPVAFRWIVLFDRFGRTGDEKISAELRQLEKDLRMLVEQTGSTQPAVPQPTTPNNNGQTKDQVAEQRAKRAAGYTL